MKKIIFAVVLLFVTGAYFFWDDLFFSPNNWVQTIPEIGSASSPRAIDLNNDGVLDIVMGGGGREFTSTKYGVFALDGKSGEMLWSVPSRNQVIGSPDFMDLNKDGTPDVIIGGRTTVLYAINGKSGELFWEFMPSYEGMDIVNDRSILNFYNPQFIPDQDGDGLEDILISYGGFIKAQPTETDRPAGSLMVISSKTGTALAKADMPDGRETYMTAVVYDFGDADNPSVLFGSGGETINGHFYKTDLNSVMHEDISHAKILAYGNGKGFIAPPVLTDVNNDGIKDIIINSVRGAVYCIDGSTDKTLWEADLGSEFEGYTSPSPGNFNNDDTPDFFVSYGHGIWPAIDFAYQVALDGRDGSIISADTAGSFQYASPISFDFNDDGLDEALVIINDLVTQKEGLATLDIYVNDLTLYEPMNQSKYRFHERKSGSNLGSTPLLTDLDGDNHLDIIYCYMDDPINYYSFKSLKIERIETENRLYHPVRWGEYMGPNHNGTYQR